MPDARRFIQQLRETPATLSSLAGSRRLPPDVLRQASRRLQVVALMSSVLWLLGTALMHLVLHTTSADPAPYDRLQPADLIAAGAAAVSLALYFFLRRRERDAALVTNLGLVYMVATCFGISTLMHWGLLPEDAGPVRPMITWVGPVILMFAALAPVPPAKMFLVGLVAASMDPLGMVLLHNFGSYPHGRLADLAVMHYPTYLLLGVAVVISNVVTGLGRQVSRERELGSYRLEERLGGGGMGEVYRASHRMLARPAAIKLIRPELLAGRDTGTAQLATARFRREAEAAAHLRSPHTVELYDFGVTEEGTFYAAMELLDGITLEALVERDGPIPAPRAIDFLLQVCDSLAEAHLAGLIHRDIKPANIHVGRLGLHQDFIKVLDFGLVKSVDDRRQESAVATQVGEVAGTPAYMAPEMAGDEPVDGRADIYALGCVAYYLLTGRLVFQAGTALQMIASHLQEAPVPPSVHAAQPIPPELDRLILACLAKRPEDRPPSAGEVARALASMQDVTRLTPLVAAPIVTPSLG